MDRPVSASLRSAELFLRARMAPYQQDFYALSRALENARSDLPRLGAAQRPIEEPVRYGQDVELTFAPAAISSCGEPDAAGTVRVGVRFGGMFGPNGPLPLHMTEYARRRMYNEGDRTLAAFTDIFHHRMILLLYRAWGQAQPAIWLDRDDDARFDTFVGSFFGAGERPWWGRDAVQDDAKRGHAGLLARGVRHAEGLRDILADYLRVPVAIDSFVGHWMPMQRRDQTRLGERSDSARLGGGAMAGDAVWDRQHKFRIRVGPLSWQDYRRFLPGAACARIVRDWVRQYIGFELAWDLAVDLCGDEVPAARLDGACRLGLTGWLGGAAGAAVRADLVYDPEAWPGGEAPGVH